MKLMESQVSKVGAALLFIFSLLLFLIIIPSQIQEVTTFGVSPRFLPNIIAVLLMVLSVLLFYEGHVKRNSSRQTVYNIDMTAIRLVGISFAAMVGYQLLAYDVGYIITASVFMFFLMCIFGQKNKKIGAAISILLPTGIYFFFREVLRLYLP